MSSDIGTSFKQQSPLCLTPLTLASPDSSIRHINLGSNSSTSETLQSAAKIRSKSQDVLAKVQQATSSPLSQFNLNNHRPPLTTTTPTPYLHYRASPGHFLLHRNSKQQQSELKNPPSSVKKEGSASIRALDDLREKHAQMLEDYESALRSKAVLEEQNEALHVDIARGQQEKDAVNAEIKAKEELLAKLSHQQAGKVALLEQLTASVATRRPEVEETEEEAVEVQIQLCQAREQLESVTLELGDVKAELEQTRQDLEDKANSLRQQLMDKLKDGTAAVESQLAEAKLELASICEEKQKEMHVLEMMQGQRKETAQALEVLNEELAAAAYKLYKLQQHTETVVSEEVDTSEKLGKAKDELLHAMGELSATRKAAEEALQLATNMYREGAAAEQTKLATQEQASQLETQLLGLQANIKDAEEKLECLQPYIEEAVVAEQQVIQLQERMEGLLCEISDSQQELLLLHSHIARAHQDKHSAHEASIAAQQQLADIQSSVWASEKELTIVQNQKHEASTALAAKRLEINHIAEVVANERGALDILKQQIEEAKSARESITRELGKDRQLAEVNANLNQELKEAKDVVAQMEKKLESMQAATIAGQRATMQALEDAETRLAITEHHLHTVQLELQYQQEEAEGLRVALEESQQQSEEYSIQNDQLTESQGTEIENLHSDIEQLRRQLQAAQREVQLAICRAEAAELQFRAADDQLTIAIEEKEREADASAEAMSACEEAKEGEAARRRELTRLHASMCELKEQTLTLSKLSTRLQEERDGGNRLASTLQLRCDALEEALKTEQRQREADNYTVRRRLDGVEKLKADNSALRAAAARLSKALAACLNKQQGEGGSKIKAVWPAREALTQLERVEALLYDNDMH